MPRHLRHSKHEGRHGHAYEQERGAPGRKLGKHAHRRFAGHAEKTLGQILPEETVKWLIRAASFGPPEMIAIFKSQVAVVDAAINVLSAMNAAIPEFDEEEVEDSADTVAALTVVMTAREAAIVMEDLFEGPEEVQAIAFLSLTALRLLEVVSSGDKLTKVKNASELDGLAEDDDEEKPDEPVC